MIHFPAAAAMPSRRFPAMTTESWVTINDVVRHLGVSRDTVYRRLESKGLRAPQVDRLIYVSPPIAQALLAVYPDFAPSPMEARRLLKEQYPNGRDITSQQMEDAVHDALTTDGKIPLTLIALDEVNDHLLTLDEKRKARAEKEGK